nr:bifunctional [glutamate--ammonia ligase]-adenylyl-L-tyrosine phosphorylase/[glutamate--ammonia-ligase] adenylyltransferase [Cellvibrionaceae bacterium]
RVITTDTPEETLKRVLPLVQTIARRSAYLSLLCENPDSLKRLVELARTSPWIAAQLQKNPALLDELLDDRSLYQMPDKTQLQRELRAGVSAIASQDLEAQMEFLRYFRNAHALRVAACEVSGAMPVMIVSDYLTYLAEVILQYALQYVWTELVAKYGYPDGDEREQSHFAVIGYGKLGGIELGHSSDLDLVFIHDAALNGDTDGNSRGLKSIDNHTFFTRMGQKIIHLLNTKTPSGELYEVDMRLRPSGNSGLLVSAISGFEKYQRENAWNWEHQALVRARAIAGDPGLCEKFERIRQDILQTPRDLKTLAAEVVAMREKMRAHLGSKPSRSGRSFHIKHDPGGIVDIEFMVQYAVLAWSHAKPGLASFTDNIRILENLEQSNKLSAEEVAQLIEAYKAFRSVGHRLALQNLPSHVDGKSLHGKRQSVLSIWQNIFSPANRS